MTPPAEYVADAHARFRARVEAAAARILKDRDEAADVASETFLAMLERGPDSQGATLAWLLASARNRALNRLRSRSREARRAVAAAPRETEPDPTAAAIAPAGLVAGAAARLGARDRRALELRFVHEYSYEEIAAALATTPAQARVVVSRAARRLKRETVRLLAEHHHASAACRRAILAGALNGGIKRHDGCVPCTSVADEVAALAARGLLPPALPALASHAQSLWTRMPMVRAPGAATRLAEALAALLVAGAATLSAGPQAPATPDGMPARSTGPAPVVATAAGDAGRVAAQASKAVAAAAGVQGLVITDAGDDAAAGLQPPPVALPLALPVTVPDALHDASDDGGHDVRRFEVGLTRDRSALVFRFVLAGRPGPGSVYSAGWGMHETCFGSAYTRTADPRGATPQDAATSFTLSCTGTETLLPGGRYFDVPAVAVHGRDFVDIAVAFRDMSAELRRLFAPGAVMRGVNGSTSEVVGAVWVNRDTVPDSGEAPDYVIPGS